VRDKAVENDSFDDLGSKVKIGNRMMAG